jgi:4-cresol dehydrogenase (hydroxylating) flavoprotein subunit
MSIGEALAAWRSLLGDAAVMEAPAASARYGSCTTGASRQLLGAVRPHNAAEVPELVRIAARTRVPLYPISTGHNWGYGTALPSRDGCVVLDLSRLTEIRKFDPESGVITLEPGVTQAMLAEFLDQGGHAFMVPVTGAGPSCSIVGNALERGYGITPHSDHFAAVTALEAVLPDGRVYRPALSEIGGEQVDHAFKWGIGPYLDGLFAQGGFGVVTAMTVVLARRPEAVKAFLFSIESNEALGDGVVAVRDIVARLPGVVGGINLMNAHRVLAMSAAYPRERLGADEVLPDSVIHELGARYGVRAWTGFGTLYGTARVVRAAQRDVRAALRGVATGLVFVSPKVATRLNAIANRAPAILQRRFGRRFQMLDSGLKLVAGRPNEATLPLVYWKSGALPGAEQPLDPARDGCGLIWYAPLVPVKPERVRRYVDLVKRVLQEHSLEPLITLTTLSDRCFDSSVPLLFDPASAKAVARAHACYRALLQAGQREGFLPYRIATIETDWLVAQPSTYWDVVSQIKRAVDPDFIVAPGRYAR